MKPDFNLYEYKIAMKSIILKMLIFYLLRLSQI